jgi:hypothetical protein
LRKTLIIIVIVLAALSYVYFRFGQFDSKLALNNQLEHILKEPDPATIQTISLDQPTKEFLLHLPNNTKVHATSDFQGGSKEIGYFVTSVGNRPLHIYMKVDTKTIFHKLFPKWTLFKVTIASNGQLPSIPDLVLE